MAPVKSLRDPVALGPITTRNRIAIPPMVLYGFAGADGLVTPAHVAHYRALAQGGAGLILQEATCVSPTGKLRGDQLGIWSEEHVPGLSEITEAVHGAGCPILVQLHHGGLMSTQAVGLCPVDARISTAKGEKVGRAMTLAEIHVLRDQFISAAKRAYQAGYDGVELHGCHGYLLCQFLNEQLNRRTDRYGDPTALVLEILSGIRAALPKGFLVGVRLGVWEPDLAAGIRHAQVLEKAGVDFLNLSYGFPQTPQPDFSALHGAAGQLRAAVSCPVFVVGGIRTPQDGEAVLRETDADLIAVGRSALVDPDWPRKALAGEMPKRCLDCRVCQWRIDSAACPGRRL